MKKLLLSAILIASSFGSLSAQEISFGAKLGLNVATFVGDDTEDVDSKLGINVGAFIEIPLANKFTIQPELLYSTQGSKEDELGVEVDLQFGYINIPVLFKYYVSEKFNIQVGPQIGFLVKSDMEFTSEGESITIDLKDIDELKISTVDFGLNFGLGYNLSQKFLIDARYNLGLSNVMEPKDVSIDESLKNSVFQLSVGYRF